MSETDVLSKRQMARLLYEQGKTTRAIAEILKLNHVTVWRWCRDIKRSKHGQA